MKISELFRSIQGEGKLAGMPSVFVRTSVCNLRCVWCDTPYTSWNPEFVDLSIEDIVREVLRFSLDGDMPASHVVITGGEPFLQARELDILCRNLREAGHHITIETNATIFKPVHANLISMSPKLRNSSPPSRVPGTPDRISERHDERRINVEVIRRFLQHFEKPPESDCQVKFVVESEKDLEEIRHLEIEASIPKDKILLMPQATDRHELATRTRWLEAVCARTGYARSPRLHIELFGNQRGM